MPGRRYVELGHRPKKGGGVFDFRYTNFVVFSFRYQANDGTTTDNSSSWNILRDDFMMGAKMKDWNREEQQTKRKDKKVTNITDYELETSHADFFDESDEGDNEESESSSDEG